MFITLFLRAKNGNDPNVPWTDEWINKVWYIHTMESRFGDKKEYTDTIHNIDKPQKRYAK